MVGGLRRAGKGQGRGGMEKILGQGLGGVCWGPVAHCRSGGLNFCAHCQLDLSNVTLEFDDENTRETDERDS